MGLWNVECWVFHRKIRIEGVFKNDVISESWQEGIRLSVHSPGAFFNSLRAHTSSILDCLPGDNTLSYWDLQLESLTSVSLLIVRHGFRPPPLPFDCLLCCLLIFIPELELGCPLFWFPTQFLWPTWIAPKPVKVSESPGDIFKMTDSKV